MYILGSLASVAKVLMRPVMIRHQQTCGECFASCTLACVYLFTAAMSQHMTAATAVVLLTTQVTNFLNLLQADLSRSR